MIHFRNKFHAVGHGTFFSGHIWHEGRDTESFVWVYDCGSKRPSRIRGLVEAFSRREGGAGQLDLLSISHFDSDHICGLSELLKGTSVDILALPYLTIKDRLLLASGVSEEAEPYAASVVAMTLDPLRYLASQGFAEQIGKVVFVRGGGADGEPAEPVPNSEGPLAEGGPKERFVWTTRRDTPNDYDFGPRYGLNVEWASHRAPLVAAAAYELVFYNPAQMEDVLPKGRSTANVKAEVAQIVDDFDLVSGRPPKDGWVEALTDCYTRNFGARPVQKNEISLCVFGGPLVTGPFVACKWFSKQDAVAARPLSMAVNKNSVLLTGDIVLNGERLNRIQAHLGNKRWKSLHVMQIPHHGSRNNWEVGTASHCAHTHSVFCAPGTAKHPDKQVTLDLATRNPVVANYEDAICFDFHTK